MKLNGIGNGGRVDSTAPGAAPRAGGTDATASAGKAAKDQVKLSGLSATLSEMGTRLSAAPEFDQAKVEKIKSAIANGELKINPEAVADKLVQSVRDLLAGKA